MRVLELAAGPGDTGFLAAELIKPGGDADFKRRDRGDARVARGRARQMGIDNVEFRQLELEWIDTETASVDAILCRWGVMLILDPPAAVQEMRRVLRPGGRVALAVWDESRAEPVGHDPGARAIELGHTAAARPKRPRNVHAGGAGRARRAARRGGLCRRRGRASVELPGATSTLAPTSASSSTSQACSRRSSASSPTMSRRRSGAESGNFSPTSPSTTGRSGCPDRRSSRPQTPE